MIFMVLAFCALASVTAIALAIAINCGYRNGVVDGYGYAKEPWNRGYQIAGDFLKREMAHRWPELVRKEKPVGPQTEWDSGMPDGVP